MAALKVEFKNGYKVHVKSVIDECPGAYKNIDEVIENESDLVEVIMKLKPIANIKG